MKNEIRNLLALEDDAASERNRALPAEIDLIPRRGRAGGELAHFVKFPIPRQVRFRYHAENASARNHRGAIEQHISHFEWQADDADDGKIAGRFDDSMERRSTSVEHDALLEKIVAGVGGKSQFREENQGDPTIGSLANQREGLFTIEGRIGDSNGWNRHGKANQVVIIKVEKLSSGLHANWCARVFDVLLRPF